MRRSMKKKNEKRDEREEGRRGKKKKKKEKKKGVRRKEGEVWSHIGREPYGRIN